MATANGTEPARRQPTLQDMLRHTAGVSYGNRGDTPLHKLYPAGCKTRTRRPAPQFLEALGKLPLHYQPGTVWEYSHGLDVAGLAVEAVTKKRLGEFLQERLFTPLGMVDTGFVVPAAKAARIAKPLPIDPDTGRPPAFRVPVKPWQYDCGGGCASGTAIDYMRFAQMLLNKGTLDGTRVLSRKTVEYMTADHLGADGRCLAPARVRRRAHRRLRLRSRRCGAAADRHGGRSGHAGRVPVERRTGNDVLGRSEGGAGRGVPGQHAGTGPAALSRAGQDAGRAGDR